MSQNPLDYLFSLEQFGIKFGLDNIAALTAALDHPERAFHSIHVAGTNGKGSVTAIVDAALRAAGHRSARYTSPHLVDLAERFVIDGEPVARETMIEAVGRVREAAERLIAAGTLRAHPTFFEVTTAAAFDMFRRAGVTVAVCEVGLGGRLDATNVLQPVVTAITSIAFDHQQYLGDTLAAIAWEKAGILKPGIPAVIGDLPRPADATVEQIASERGCALIRAPEGVIADRLHQRLDGTTLHLATPTRDYGNVQLSLAGHHQVDNAIVAVRVLEEIDRLGIRIPAAAIVTGLGTVRWPGRLERRLVSDGRELLLDAAHNPAGAAALASYLKEIFSDEGARRPLVFAAMGDKDSREMLRLLAPHIEALIVTRASHPRSVDPAALATLARGVAASLPIVVERDVNAALAAAWRRSPRIAVAGSIFLLGDVIERLRRP